MQLNFLSGEAFLESFINFLGQFFSGEPSLESFTRLVSGEPSLESFDNIFSASFLWKAPHFFSSEPSSENSIQEKLRRAFSGKLHCIVLCNTVLRCTRLKLDLDWLGQATLGFTLIN